MGEGTVCALIEAPGKSGETRAALPAIDADLPDRHRATFGSAAVKDVAGLDLKRLVAGSRGGLGGVRRATLQVRPVHTDAAHSR